MNLIKKLFLGGVLLSTCSFANNYKAYAVKDYDFKYTIKAIEEDQSDHFSNLITTFKYGQEFVCVSPVDDTKDVDFYTKLQFISSDKNTVSVKINGPSDLKKYLIDFKKNKSWKLENDKFQIVPINGLKSNVNLSTQFSIEDAANDLNIVDTVWGDSLDNANPYEDAKYILAELDYDGNFPKVSEIDLNSPVINGYQGVYLSNVNSPITVQTVKSQLKATDDLDGDLTSQIQIENDQFTGNERKVGKYPVTFTVEDKAHNKASITIEIHVIDADLPVFNGPSTFTSNLSNKLTVEQIKQQIQVSDNYDKEITYTVETDEFTGKENIPGNYKMKFKAVDSSNNIAFKEVTITVVDDIKPTISGNTKYKTSYDKKITLDTIKNSLTVNDNVDKLDKSNLVLVEDTYTQNYNKSGTYHVKYKVVDTAGNESQIFDITIEVVDEKLPVFEVSDYIINLDHFTTLSREQILELLKNSGQIQMDRISNPDEQIKIVEDSYNGTDEPGKYKMKLSVTYDDGETKDIDFTINKLENPNQVNLPWYQVAWNWVMDYIFEPVINFFKNIGRTISSWFK